MRIDRIELRHIRMELITPFETSMGIEKDEEHIIVRVDGEGVTGWGESVAEGTPFYSYETVQTAWHILRDFLIPSVLGRNITSIDEAIALNERVRGHMMAKAGLEAALWDLFAGAGGSPFPRCWGARATGSTSASASASRPPPHTCSGRWRDTSAKGTGGSRSRSPPDGISSSSRRCAASIPISCSRWTRTPPTRSRISGRSKRWTTTGFSSSSSRWGTTTSTITASFRGSCEHRSAWTRAFTPSPMPARRWSCRAARSSTSNPDGWEGSRTSRAIHDLCASQKVPVWHGGMLESGIGRAGNVALASLPNFTLPGDISASKRYYREDIVDPPFEVAADGTMAVPKGPGLGVRVVPELLEKVTVRKEVFGAAK